MWRHGLCAGLRRGCHSVGSHSSLSVACTRLGTVPLRHCPPATSRPQSPPPPATVRAVSLCPHLQTPSLGKGGSRVAPRAACKAAVERPAVHSAQSAAFFPTPMSSFCRACPRSPPKPASQAFRMPARAACSNQFDDQNSDGAKPVRPGVRWAFHHNDFQMGLDDLGCGCKQGLCAQCGQCHWLVLTQRPWRQGTVVSLPLRAAESHLGPSFPFLPKHYKADARRGCALQPLLLSCMMDCPAGTM